MQLQFNTYNALAANLQDAYAKVQAVTPAFTTLQSATVPIKKAGPKGSQIVLAFFVISFFVSTIYSLYKENKLKNIISWKK